MRPNLGKGVSGVMLAKFGLQSPALRLTRCRARLGCHSGMPPSPEAP